MTDKKVEALFTVLLFQFLIILMYAFVFGVGYGVGLVVEWLHGDEIVLGPLPMWTGFATTLISAITSHQKD